MKLYVELTDVEYEQFKAFKQKPTLEDHNSAELAAALLAVIKKEGGTIDTQDNRFDFNPGARNTVTVGKLINSNFVISLIVEKR